MIIELPTSSGTLAVRLGFGLSAMGGLTAFDLGFGLVGAMGLSQGRVRGALGVWPGSSEVDQAEGGRLEWESSEGEVRSIAGRLLLESSRKDSWEWDVEIWRSGRRRGTMLSLLEGRGSEDDSPPEEKDEKLKKDLNQEGLGRWSLGPPVSSAE